MSRASLMSRLAKLEPKTSGRLIIVRCGDSHGAEEIDEFLNAKGIQRTPQDAFVRLRWFFRDHPPELDTFKPM